VTVPRRDKTELWRGGDGRRWWMQ